MQLILWFGSGDLYRRKDFNDDDDNDDDDNDDDDNDDDDNDDDDDDDEDDDYDDDDYTGLQDFWGLAVGSDYRGFQMC